MSDFDASLLHLAAGLIQEHRETAPNVLPRASVADLETRLKAIDFAEPIQAEALLPWIAEHLQLGNVHTTHPRYFGLFNPSTHPITVAADAMVAGFNPQLAAASHAFGALTIERHTLAVFQRLLGHTPGADVANFTSGGAEANHSGVLAAAISRLQGFADGETQGARCYVSEHAHDSFAKIVKFCGLGREALVRVPTDSDRRMDVEALRNAVDHDRARGLRPFIVVGTAGTTAFGAIDPLPDLASFCAAEDLWFHVDAAWGGAGIVSPRLEPLFEGIERADSVTLDAHKWLSVPMGAGMFFCRHAEACQEAFGVDAVYMPPRRAEMPDPYTSTMQWSRRFIGLKVFSALANLGLRGLAEHIERQCALADRLAELALERGYRVEAHSPLALVVLTKPGLAIPYETWLERIYAHNDAWVSLVPLGDGRKGIRACVTHYATQASDLERLLEIMDAAAG
ncbi:MAG: hypothetical protein K8H99_08405 [Nitrospirae bacterium]|nr:hypothetical protein [Fimbriimonadaceae bacterium]